jgi:hypothetical protein
MRYLWFAGAAAVMALVVAPWLMATFDCASYSEDLLTVVHPATGSAPNAQQLAELAEQLAGKHDLVAHARVTVEDPRIDNPSKPDDPDNRVQDVRLEIDLEKKLPLFTKRSRTVYNLALGGKGSANAWPSSP